MTAPTQELHRSRDAARWRLHSDVRQSITVKFTVASGGGGGEGGEKPLKKKTPPPSLSGRCVRVPEHMLKLYLHSSSGIKK